MALPIWITDGNNPGVPVNFSQCATFGLDPTGLLLVFVMVGGEHIVWKFATTGAASTALATLNTDIGATTI